MASIVETIFDAVKDHVMDNIKPILKETERDSGDSLTLPMFKQVFRGDTDIMSIKQFPSLLMRYGQVEITNETTGSDLMTIPITFWVMTNGSKLEDLQRKLERYAWCLKELFDEDRTLGGIAVESMVTGISFSPVFSGQQSSQMSFIDTEIQVLVTRT